MIHCDGNFNRFFLERYVVFSKINARIYNDNTTTAAHWQ